VPGIREMPGKYRQVFERRGTRSRETGKAVAPAGRGLGHTLRVTTTFVWAGWAVSERTAAASMRAQGLVGRLRRHHWVTRPDRAGRLVPHRVSSSFSAVAIKRKVVR